MGIKAYRDIRTIKRLTCSTNVLNLRPHKKWRPIYECEPPSLPSSLPVGSVEVFDCGFQLLTASGVTGQFSENRPIVFG